MMFIVCIRRAGNYDGQCRAVSYLPGGTLWSPSIGYLGGSAEWMLNFLGVGTGGKGEVTTVDDPTGKWVCWIKQFGSGMRKDDWFKDGTLRTWQQQQQDCRWRENGIAQGEQDWLPDNAQNSDFRLDRWHFAVGQYAPAVYPVGKRRGNSCTRATRAAARSTAAPFAGACSDDGLQSSIMFKLMTMASVNMISLTTAGRAEALLHITVHFQQYLIIYNNLIIIILLLS